MCQIYIDFAEVMENEEDDDILMKKKRRKTMKILSSEILTHIFVVCIYLSSVSIHKDSTCAPQV